MVVGWRVDKKVFCVMLNGSSCTMYLLVVQRTVKELQVEAEEVKSFGTCWKEVWGAEQAHNLEDQEMTTYKLAHHSSLGARECCKDWRGSVDVSVCVCVCVCVCGQNTFSDGDGCVGSSFISDRCFSVPLPCITHTPSIHCCTKKPGGVRQANDWHFAHWLQVWILLKVQYAYCS